MKMENNNIKDIPEYDFLKGKLTQTKALKTLCKRIRHDGVVMTYYEMIESFPAALSVENQNICSTRAESGHVSKLCIGNHICYYKVEADYYNYLSNGGRKYSDYLAEVKQIEEHNEAIKTQEREDQQAKEILQYRQEHDENIRFALTTPLEEYIRKALGTAPEKLEEYRKERQTQFIKGEIKYIEEFIPHRTKIAQEAHIRTNMLYVLNGDAVEEKFKYNIGDKVILSQRDKEYKTVIEEKRENMYGYLKYKVKMVDGMVNAFCGYYELLPENK